MISTSSLPQQVTRWHFPILFFHSQHNDWVLIQKNSSDLGHFIFSPLAEGGVLTFYGVYGPDPPCGPRVTESTYNVLFVKARSTYRILPFSMAQDRRYVAANPPSHNHRHLTASTSQVIR